MGLFQRSSRAYSLGDAAQRALDTARQEKLALLHIAEREGEPQFWFALNILGLVAVEGRRIGTDRAAPLDRSSFNAFVLDADMTKLCAGPSEEITELQVSAHEFDKYLRWARTVQ